MNHITLRPSLMHLPAVLLLGYMGASGRLKLSEEHEEELQVYDGGVPKILADPHCRPAHSLKVPVKSNGEIFRQLLMLPLPIKRF